MVATTTSRRVEPIAVCNCGSTAPPLRSLPSVHGPPNGEMHRPTSPSHSRYRIHTG